jgi:hypothetical protein
MILEHLTLNGPVAQWLAQGTHNSLVAGSNPAGPTFSPFFNVKIVSEPSKNKAVYDVI